LFHADSTGKGQTSHGISTLVLWTSAVLASQLAAGNQAFQYLSKNHDRWPLVRPLHMRDAILW